MKLSGGAKGAMFAFDKGHKALAGTGCPQDCISHVQAQTQHEDFLSFSATQNNVLRQKKTIQIQVLIFALPPLLPPPTHTLLNRKMADEPLKAKVHPSAVTCVSSAAGGKHRAQVPSHLRNVEKEKSAIGTWSATNYSPGHRWAI